MISRLIFVTGLVLLCLSIVSFILLLWLSLSPKPAFEMIPLPQPGPGRGYKCIKYALGCGSGGGLPIISNLDPSELAIVGELPKQMDSSTSDTIQVKLTLLGSQERNGSFTIKDRTILLPDISNSLDIDMANYCSLHSSSGQEYSNCSRSFLSMKDLFGPDYELFASAHLVATSFDVQLLGAATEQSADQFSIEWDWNIFPKSAGNQPINLDVDLHWKSVGNNGKEDVFRQIWESNPTITVNPPSFITLGQLTISSAVSAFFGLIFSGVSGPMVLGELKKRRAGKQKEPADRELLEQELEQERAERERLERKLEQEQADRELLERKLEQERAERERLERKLGWPQHLRRERLR